MVVLDDDTFNALRSHVKYAPRHGPRRAHASHSRTRTQERGQAARPCAVPSDERPAQWCAVCGAPLLACSRMLTCSVGRGPGLRAMQGVYTQLEAAQLGTDTDNEMHALGRWVFLAQWAMTLAEAAAKAPGASLSAVAAPATAAAPAKGARRGKGTKAASRAAAYDQEEEDDDDEGGAKRGAASASLATTWPAQKEGLVGALRDLLRLPLGRVYHVTTERDALLTYARLVWRHVRVIGYMCLCWRGRGGRAPGP
jgi:hypothetical protein